MAQITKLFLLGASPAQQAYADEFVNATGGRHAVITVLAQTRAGWEKYKAEITHPFLERDVDHFLPVTPDDAGVIDHENAFAALNEATGILICGGSTPLNQKLFAAEPLRTILRERYLAGIPVAGISAGALVALEICPLLPEETGSSDIHIVQGLGLAQGFVIGVHFTEWNALPGVLEVMSRTRTSTGYGIDEPACVVLEEGKFSHVLGCSVFQVEMTDFEKKSHQIKRLS